MNTPARRKHGTVLGAIKTKPLRVGLPARLDSPCARRLSVPRPGRRNGHSNRTKKLALLNKQGQRVIFCLHPSSRLKNIKGKISPVLYVTAIALSFVDPLIAGIIYVSVAVMWLIPDRRIERALVE